jgi:hypothetical protein
MGGYQLMVSADIFRGRYRESLETAKPHRRGTPLPYRSRCPTANHVFLPGHRIMVQVQSSWFPLYDRNPQTFVPNIFFAKPADYRKAVQRVYSTSSIELPIRLVAMRVCIALALALAAGVAAPTSGSSPGPKRSGPAGSWRTSRPPSPKRSASWR